MDKSTIKSILMSLRTPDNQERVNYFLGQIDMLSEDKIQSELERIGDNEESVKDFFQKKLEERERHFGQEHKPLNKMFTYGEAGKTIHLHMPIQLKGLMDKIGIRKTIDTVNLYLLDAIDKVAQKQENGTTDFKDKESIYMISPILVGRELAFLEDLGFSTKTFSKRDLKDDDFVRANPEARLATTIFGNLRNIGTAIIDIDKVKTQEWQERKMEYIEKFAQNGVTFESNEREEQ